MPEVPTMEKLGIVIVLGECAGVFLWGVTFKVKLQLYGLHKCLECHSFTAVFYGFYLCEFNCLVLSVGGTSIIGQGYS